VLQNSLGIQGELKVVSIGAKIKVPTQTSAIRDHYGYYTPIRPFLPLGLSAT
jgi:hypothetical protein